MTEHKPHPAPDDTSTGNDVPTRMKAITQDRYGNADVLSYGDFEIPGLPSNRVLVRMIASSLNMYDVHMTTGYPLLARLSAGPAKPKNPIPGADIAGIVERVGADVEDFAPGDAVFGDIGSGAFAEYAVTGTRSITQKPDPVSFEAAAAAPLAGMTALQGLRDVGRLRPGQRVIINGASGGVGTFAVQIAKTLGAEVAAVCSTSKVDMVRSIGADVVVDYRKEDYTERLRGYDLLFDNAGDRPWSETRHVLTAEGTNVTITGPKHRIAGPVRHLLFRRLLSRFGNQSLTWFTARTKREDLDTLGEWLSTGAISPVIERTYDLEHVPDGLRYLSEGHALGKLVIAT